MKSRREANGIWQFCNWLRGVLRGHANDLVRWLNGQARQASRFSGARDRGYALKGRYPIVI